MTHVLLGGEAEAIEAIRAYLADWGVTCGTLQAGQDPAGVPLLECDVVILGCGPALAGTPKAVSGQGEGSPGSHERDPGPFSEVAPLLVVGDPSGHQAGLPKVWSVIADPGPQGDELRRALQACCERTREMRSRLREMHLFNDYAQFLGHELRSPLTAVKTALEVLEGDLGGMAGGDPAAAPDDMRLKMVEIALRNVRRLHRTVDWSQDLLVMSESRPQARLRRVPLQEFLLGLEVEIPVDLGDAGARAELRTDPDLLGKLLEQSIRVLEFFRPEQDLRLRFQAQEGRLNLHLEADRPGGGQQPRPLPTERAQADPPINARTHVLDPLHSPREARDLELTRLAEFLISGHLLDVLQVDLAVAAAPQRPASLVLAVPLWDGSSAAVPPRTAASDLVYSGSGF